MPRGATACCCAGGWRRVANGSLDFLQRDPRIDTKGHERPAGERIPCEKRPVQLQTLLIGIAIDDARDADGVVIGEEIVETGEAIGEAWRLSFRLRRDVTSAVPEDPAGLPVRLRSTRQGSLFGQLEIRVDAAHRERHRVQRCVRPYAKCDGMLGGPCRARRALDIAARGVA